MTYFQAFVIALVQGVTELFPVSSLGNSVLVPAWFGGSWQALVTQSSQQSSESSFYLAYIVALHCATALALMWFFRADRVRIIAGFFRSLPASVRLTLDQRRLRLTVADKDERLAWMIIFATIPVGLVGVALEHTFRVLFAKPEAAAVLLSVNGLILLAAEAMRRSAIRRGQEGARTAAVRSAQAYASPAVPGTAAPWAPGSAAVSGYPGGPDSGVPGRPGAGRPTAPVPAAIGRPGSHRKPAAGRETADITMAGGLWRGLDHEDAARFAFLLATPVILAAGVLKVPSLLGPAGAHIHGQVIVGVIVCAIAAYLSVRFLVRWFQTRTLTPFAIYCLAFGVLSILRFL